MTPPTAHDADEAGQGLVEFTMVIPFIVVLLMALLELAFALNASLAVNRASQDGAHLAATAGSTAGTDCLVLKRIEQEVMVPNDARRILEVVIERTALAGNLSYAQQTWSRSGATDCTMPDGTVESVPYTLTSGGYPESQRCQVLGGCPGLTPPRSTVDNIGVRIRYRHDWITPLSAALGLLAPGGHGSAGWTFEQRNIFRIEPTL